ncbi:MAG: ThuA domain-containing protein [Hyphomonas sp.]
MSATLPHRTSISARWFALIAGCLFALFAGLTACARTSADTPPEAAPAVLIFSHTTGYRHASIEAGVAALTDIAADQGYRADASENPDIFSAEGLAPYSAILLLSATTAPNDPESEWLTGERRDAFQDFVRSGRGVVAIHAAADSHYHWPWYRQMIGGAFARHPPGTPEGRVVSVAPDDPVMQGLPAEILRSDEWYYFKDLSEDTTLLAAFDPLSIGEPGPDLRPLSWRHEFEGGRIFYTGMGHTEESFSEAYVRGHIAAGLDWVLDGAP